MNQRAEQFSRIYDLVMWIYFVGGLACVPMIIGESLLDLGGFDSIYETGLPEWIIDFFAGYEILLLFSIGAAALIVWIPALILLYIFRRSWRVIIPAALLVGADASLLLLSASVRTDLFAILGIACITAAFLIGLEWVIRRYYFGEKDVYLTQINRAVP